MQQVKEDIERRLKDGYIKNPQVTVQVLQYNEQYYTVMGEVKIAGIYPLPPEKRIDLVEAIAKANGFSPMPRKTALSCGEKVKESATTTTNCSRSRTRTRKSTSRRETRLTFLIVSSDPNVFYLSLHGIPTIVSSNGNQCRGEPESPSLLAHSA